MQVVTQLTGMDICAPSVISPIGLRNWRAKFCNVCTFFPPAEGKKRREGRTLPAAFKRYCNGPCLLSPYLEDDLGYVKVLSET